MENREKNVDQFPSVFIRKTLFNNPTTDFIVQILEAIVIRIAFVAFDIAPWLQSRMELAAPPTSLDHYADIAFLQSTRADIPSATLATTSPLMVAFTRATGAHLLPATSLATAADLLSTIFLYRIALGAGFPIHQARIYAIVYIWNPLSMAVAVAGSAADAIRTAMVLAAIYLSIRMSTHSTSTSSNNDDDANSRKTMRGGGEKHSTVCILLLGIALACSLHFSRSTHIILIALPLLANAVTSTTTTTTTLAGWLALFLFSFLGTTLLLLTTRMQSMTILFSGQSLLQLPLQQFFGLHPVGTLSPSSRLPPLIPNIGVQWYLFAQVFPIFRRFFSYVFAALQIALCTSVYLRFHQDIASPHAGSGSLPLLGVVVAQEVVVGMLSAHPTYADIMLWLVRCCCCLRFTTF